MLTSEVAVESARIKSSGRMEDIGVCQFRRGWFWRRIPIAAAVNALLVLAIGQSVEGVAFVEGSTAIPYAYIMLVFGRGGMWTRSLEVSLSCKNIIHGSLWNSLTVLYSLSPSTTPIANPGTL